MTKNEEKELELFKEWWKTVNIPNDTTGYALKSVAEQGWLARAELDKLDRDKFTSLNTFGYMIDTE